MCFVVLVIRCHRASRRDEVCDKFCGFHLLHMGYLFFHIERVLWVLWVLCEIFSLLTLIIFLTQNSRNTQISILKIYFWCEEIAFWINRMALVSLCLPGERNLYSIKTLTSLCARCRAGNPPIVKARSSRGIAREHEWAGAWQYVSISRAMWERKRERKM